MASLLQAVKYPIEFDVNEFCDASLQDKMKPARDLLRKQADEKAETKKRQKLEEKEGVVTAVDTSQKESYKNILKAQGLDSGLLNGNYIILITIII